MDSILQTIVIERLKDASGLDEDAQLFVLLALEGAGHLNQALEGNGVQRSGSEVRAAPDAPRPGAFLQSISVEGFRGVGSPRTLELHPGPGLTLVIGRNGSGKSSFAEALEMLLTANSKRWSDRSAVIWKQGWRNLHHPTTAIAAEAVLQGEPGPMKITRTWDSAARLDESRVEVQRHGRKKEPLEALGWSDALQAYRPFLSYNELGSMFDKGPTSLYGALGVVLGLEDLVAAEDALKDAQKVRKRDLENVKADLAPLIVRLRQIDDDRAQRCVAALDQRHWNLDEAQEIALGVAASPDAPQEVGLLRQVAALDAPARDEVDQVIQALRSASARETRLAGSDAARAHDVAALLTQALEIHSLHGDQECPVCGTGALTNEWRRRTTTELKRQRALAAEAADAAAAVYQARKRAQSMLVAAPSLLDRVALLGIETADAKQAYQEWSAGSSEENLERLADHLDMSWGPLVVALSRLKREADKEIERREALWRPVAADLVAWIQRARLTQSAGAHLASLKKAGEWMKAASDDIRNDRFAPIAGKSQAIWGLLKQQSSVELESISLAGTGNQRKVELKVTIDGKPSDALGVMSQGELHSLALSLFLPRATLDESPFRFIVIDDPVQSMDPSRVDGLARVLEQAAGDRQVVVFTHDDRLPRACRLLGVDAKVIEVYRRLNSEVELRPGHDPVTRYCQDARAIARSSELDPRVAGRIVGVTCRSALEAACSEVVTRRRLARGESYDEVDELLAGAQKLAPLLALAFFDDSTRAKDVLGHLNKVIGGWAADTYKQVQSGSHSAVAPDRLEDLVRDTERLAKGLKTVR